MSDIENLPAKKHGFLQQGIVLESVRRDGHPLISGEFNHQRWNYIMGIYAQYMSDEVIVNAVHRITFPFMSLVIEANNFPEFRDIPDNSPEQRAFNKGVRDTAGQIEYLREAQTPEQGIVTVVKLIEGFEKQNGRKPVDKPDGEYLHLTEVMNDAGLFNILTGEYSTIDGELGGRKNPEFEKFKLENANKLVDPNLLKRLGRMYQIGSRLAILQRVASIKQSSH